MRSIPDPRRLRAPRASRAAARAAGTLESPARERRALELLLASAQLERERESARARERESARPRASRRSASAHGGARCSSRGGAPRARPRAREDGTCARARARRRVRASRARARARDVRFAGARATCARVHTHTHTHTHSHTLRLLALAEEERRAPGISRAGPAAGEERERERERRERSANDHERNGAPPNRAEGDSFPKGATARARRGRHNSLSEALSARPRARCMRRHAYGRSGAMRLCSRPSRRTPPPLGARAPVRSSRLVPRRGRGGEQARRPRAVGVPQLHFFDPRAAAAGTGARVSCWMTVPKLGALQAAARRE